MEVPELHRDSLAGTSSGTWWSCPNKCMPNCTLKHHSYIVMHRAEFLRALCLQKDLETTKIRHRMGEKSLGPLLELHKAHYFHSDESRTLQNDSWACNLATADNDCALAGWDDTLKDELLIKSSSKAKCRESSNGWYITRYKQDINSTQECSSVQLWPAWSCNKTGICNKADMSNSLMSLQRWGYSSRMCYYKRSKH